MTDIDRRTLLFAFGLASVTRALPRAAGPSGTVAVAKPGANRFSFASAAQAAQSPCKVTSADSGGAITAFELNALAKTGPFLHVPHREAEGYYVLAGTFLFKAGSNEYTLPPGSSIWLPRGGVGIGPDVGDIPGKLLLMCQPGGFEHFFDEIGQVPPSEKNPEKMGELMARYGMEMLGPPIFASAWMKAH